MKKLKIAIVTIFFGLGAVAFVGATDTVSAQTIQGGLCQGSTLKVTGNGNCARDTSGSGARINDLIADIINIFSIIVAIVAVIMIIIGGFKYITSNGDSGNISSAKNTILYAIIGLIIVAFAQFIVQFVLGQASGIAEPPPDPEESGMREVMIAIKSLFVV